MKKIILAFVVVTIALLATDQAISAYSYYVNNSHAYIRYYDGNGSVGSYAQYRSSGSQASAKAVCGPIVWRGTKKTAALSGAVSRIQYGCYASGSGHWHGHATFR